MPFSPHLEFPPPMKKFSPTKIPMGGHKKFPPQGLEKWGVNILPPHNGGEEQDISPPSKWGGKRTTIRFPPTCLAPFPRPNHTFIHRSLSLPAIECQPTRARGLTPDEGPPPIFPRRLRRRNQCFRRVQNGSRMLEHRRRKFRGF